jgi:glycosyltransferase involved in cell wall biosynthesis
MSSDGNSSNPQAISDWFMETKGLTVGIDASRNRSGGAKAHLIGILTEGNLLRHGIQKIHLWAFRGLLDSIPDYPWLVKHNPVELQQSLLKQLWWQAVQLPRAVAALGCDILLTTDASTLCRVNPMVVMSRDMLSYEPGVMKYFGYTKARLRLLAILLVQNRAFRFADGVIFLTRYAAEVIQQSCGQLKSVACIPHGVGSDFKNIQRVKAWPEGDEPVQCLYVSNAEMYKHQWVVVRAIALLRKQGYPVTLKLVGGGAGKAQRLVDFEIAKCDPHGEFVMQTDFVPHKELPSLLAGSDIFVFASSCENLPATLLEAMAVGLPIACSDRGPMPEVLADAGVYFDPEDAGSVAGAVERIVRDTVLRVELCRRAKELSEKYSWARCADETWAFIAKTIEKKQV